MLFSLTRIALAVVFGERILESFVQAFVHENSHLRPCGNLRWAGSRMFQTVKYRTRDHSSIHFPSLFQLRPFSKQLSAARSIAFRVIWTG